MPTLQPEVIVLAAGRSRRMGTTKQLLPLQDKPVILHCLESFRTAGFASPVVVLSPEGGEIAAIVKKQSVTIVWNEKVHCEMADSVRTGLKYCSSHCTGLIICPADYPLVTPHTIACLAKKHEVDPGKIIIPVYKERRGHPVLFPRFLLEELTSDLTLRDIIGNHPSKVVHLPVKDEGILLDLDIPADYADMCRRMEQR